MFANLIYRRAPLVVTPSTKIRPFISITTETEFANRKARVQENHGFYYPLVNDLHYGSEAQTLRIPEFRNRFERYQFPDSSKKIDVLVSVCGKISSIRRAGKGMIFMDIIQDFTKLQLVIHHKMLKLNKEEFSSIHNEFRIGDHVSVIGYPGKTDVGELSLKASQSVKLAAPALHPLPPKLTDTAKINSHRVVDYLVNRKSQDIILARSKITSTIRKFLEDRQFVEVSTPIIANSGTGANATPFVTSSEHIKNDMLQPEPLQLRVAPELWLKKLIISGFDKVFEIGKVFRNEGIDSTHNPEFSTCEFYQTFTSLEELMSLTTDLFHAISTELLNIESLKLTHSQAKTLRDEEFKTLEFIPAIEKATGKKLPENLGVTELENYFKSIDLEYPKVKSPAQFLDTLSSEYLEPQCDKPTFIYHQPAILSPLAKSTNLRYGDRQYDISRRFELFINGNEYVNAYEEENDPFSQYEKFKLQTRSKEKHQDAEALVPDYKYVTMMEWGMPPTGGWGIGIDRLTMLLTDSARVENVLTFGKLNDVLKH
ncbi:BA75_01505T0 [Komagataella pastoris]|uniref:Lysine--tRNA ligase n=1 Tax=Komagataella pastoris TaxID=4922 RepID=A0A1B2J8K6_PICPA|nr:BA75_01505T0 [Komagataella pastoris]